MSRMISFRLPDHQFQRLDEICGRTGARSISEVARAALQSWLEAEGRLDHLTLLDRIDALEHRVQRLSAEFERWAPGNGEDLHAA